MTVHESLAHSMLAKIIDDPKAPATLSDVRRRLQVEPGTPGGFDVGYADAIGQVHRSAPSKWPMEQVAALTGVHAGIVAGNFGRIEIGGPNLEGGPRRDSDRKGNAAKLSELYGPFRAVVNMEQNQADEDGEFSWDEPAHCDRAFPVSFIPPCPREGMRRITRLVKLDPWSVPLEIGSSSPSRTFFHLIDDGAVARWPYGSDRITLFINFKPYWLRTDL